MSNDLQDMNLSSYTFDIRLVLDFVLLEDFDGDFLAGYQVRAKSDFTEGALSERTACYEKRIRRCFIQIESIYQFKFGLKLLNCSIYGCYCIRKAFHFG